MRTPGRPPHPQAPAHPEAKRKADYITKYLPTIAEALRDLLDLDEKETDTVAEVLTDTLERSRKL